jgi:2',3'-cyclic-nucleotide 2'-phosphodiesterase (5'-nucleotidase family)
MEHPSRLGAAVRLALGLALGTASLAPDRLAAQSTVDLVVMATTDVHGRLRAWDYYANRPDPARSLAGAATIVDSVRRRHPARSVLVDAGDLLQGNPLTFVAARVAPQLVHPVIASMNVMRYDAAVVGNHEFNYGVPLLRAAMERAGFPFLAANVHDASGRPFATPFTVVERSGIRVGIVGATTPGSMIWDRDHLQAAGLTVSDIVPAVRRAVADARRARADVIVVLLHSGLAEPASYDTVATGLPSENVAARVAKEVGGIDVIVYGHSHREMVDSTINGTLMVQPRNWAASVAVATLRMQRTRGRWAVTSREGQSVAVAGHAESPGVLAASSNTHRAAVAWSIAPVGVTTVRWNGDSARVADMAITDLVNEVMRREAKADLSATAAFSLEASLDSGAITVAALSRLYPYDNTLRAVKISGAVLKAFLEHSSRYYRSLDANGRVPAGGIVDSTVPGYNFDVVSGADYAIDLARPVGQRIVGLQIAGRAVQPTDTFTLALNSYRQGGGGGYAMLSGLPVVYERDVDIRTLLIDEVKRAGTLDPARYATRNWRIVPSAAVAAAFAEQTRGRAAEAAGGAPRRPSPGVPRGSERARATARTNVARAGLEGSPGPRIRTVRVIAMSDFHAALQARPEANGALAGGAVALSAALRRAQAECAGDCVSVVVDAGDMFTGAPASDWDAGRPTAAIMNELDVAAAALGNHEFDFGQDTLRMRLRELRHAVLGVNVRGTNGARPAWVRADTMVVRGGVRIGIVGAAGTHTPATAKRRNVQGLTFLEPAPLISERVRALRAAGAQVVIGILHDGVRCQGEVPATCHGGGLAVARALTERPDVFVLGHAHVNSELRMDGMPVVEPTSSGRAIAIVDLSLEDRTAASQIRVVRGDSTAGADPAVDSIIRAATAKVESRLQQPVATIAEPMTRRGNQHAVGNLVADAARASGNGDFALWNNGGIRADLRAGELRYGGVHEVSPFGNLLVRVRLRGRDLKRTAEAWVRGNGPGVHVSGLTVEYDPAKPEGSRIVGLHTADGAAIDDSRIYSLILNDFMLDDGDGLAPVGAVSQEILPVRDIDSLAAYLRRRPQPVRGSAAPRVRAVTARPR